MTKFEYDPKLPFAVVSELSDTVVGRMRTAYLANALVSNFPGGRFRVVDTTPEPKIPEDAYFISWTDPYSLADRVAVRIGHPNNNVWTVTGVVGKVSTDYVLDIIESAEVRVLGDIRGE